MIHHTRLRATAAAVFRYIGPVGNAFLHRSTEPWLRSVPGCALTGGPGPSASIASGHPMSLPSKVLVTIGDCPGATHRNGCPAVGTGEGRHGSKEMLAPAIPKLPEVGRLHTIEKRYNSVRATTVPDP